MTTFNKLGLTPAMVDTLSKRGYETPTDIQKQLIPIFGNSNDDLIAQAATGTGKTGAFGIPIIDAMDNQAGIQALIIAPTRELAGQVAKELRLFAKHTRVNVLEMCGGLGMRDQIQQLKQVSVPTIVVGTPGRIIDHMGKKRLSTRHIKWFVIDEVDEMLNFGFKEDMDQIVSFLPAERRTIILSATLPKFVMKVATAYLGDHQLINAVQDASVKPSIHEQYIRLNKVTKYQLLCRVIDSLDDFYGFVFCNTKREVDEITERLNKAGYPVESLHGDLSQAQRNRAFDRFKQRQCQVLVVTDVAARGIDVKNISHVINLSVPQNLEVYTHRIGRTGRAGKSGVAITFVPDNQMGKFKRLLNQRTIENTPLPSPKDILKNKKASFIQRVKSEKKSDFYRQLANEMMNDMTPEDALAGILSLRCGDIFAKRQY